MSGPAIEPNSPTWLFIKAWAGDRLAMHRRRLETIGMSSEETEGARHAILSSKRC